MEEKNIELYKQYRKTGETLNFKLFHILDSKTLTQSAILFNAVDETTGTFIIDSDVENDRLTDFTIHDYVDDNGETALKKLVKSNEYESLSSDEKIILDAKLNSTQSLFLVDYTKPTEGLVGLKDVFNTFQSTEIMDFGLSQSLKPQKTYVFVRLMHFAKFSCTTGSCYIFDKNKYAKVKSAYLKHIKRNSHLHPRTLKTVAFFHLDKQYGKPISFRPHK